MNEELSTGRSCVTKLSRHQTNTQLHTIYLCVLKLVATRKIVFYVLWVRNRRRLPWDFICKLYAIYELNRLKVVVIHQNLA